MNDEDNGYWLYHIGTLRELVPTSSSVLFFKFQGWASYLDDETSTFSNIPLKWERNTTIPAWVRGSYIKNGPSRKQFGDSREYASYLDSWGKLNKFTFNNGAVTFSGRMIETENYNKSMAR